MSKQEAVRKLCGEALRFLKKHKNAIRTGVSIGGYFTGIIFTAEATAKSVRAIDKAKLESEKDEFTKKETIKLVWRYWTKPVIATAAATGIQVWEYSDSKKEKIALKALAEISTNYIKECEKEAIDLIGKEKVDEIKEAVAEKEIEKSLPDVPSGKGDQLYYEPHTKTLFWSNPLKMKDAALRSKDFLSDGGKMSVNDWLALVDAPECDYGEIIGWKNYGDYGSVKAVEVLDSIDAINIKDPRSGEPFSAIVVVFMDEPRLEFDF